MNIQTITHKANEGILFQKIQLNDAINITKFNQQELEDLKLDINNSIIRFIDSLKGSNHDES